jgi:fumarylpyruvate hydrolase
MSTEFIWAPPAVPSVALHASSKRLPVQRLFFVGRNYHAHAVEMGRPVDKAKERPFYFTKSPSTLVDSGATVPYPAGTKDYHYEMELVVVIGKAGFEVKAADAHELIFGYACGLDMTRRDLQLAARDKGRPWDLGKDIEQGSVVSPVVEMPGHVITAGELALTVNGEVKQRSDVSRLIWDIREQIEDLSRFYHLRPGDLIFTGTPEGVGPVVSGDRLAGHVAGVGEITLSIA